MNLRFVLYSLGKLLQIQALVLLVPSGISLWGLRPWSLPATLWNERILGFIIAVVASFLTGTLLTMLGSNDKEPGGVREGFAIVTFGWLLFTLYGSIPLFMHLLSHAPEAGFAAWFNAFTDACFEIMSGFTTTGATILTDVESLPRGILFWRSMTHWLGGMGIVTLAVVIFPAFGVAAYQMFRGEVPGPSTERLMPRVAQTATVLWAVYVLLSVAETLLLMVGGMSLFDALCHTFGTMATGGFSTRNASIAAYDSNFIDWVIVVFMFLAGTNFIIHYRILFAGDFGITKRNREFQFYLIAILVAVGATTLLLQTQGIADRDTIASRYRSTSLTEEELDLKHGEESQRVRTPYHTLRYAAFQVVSITTTTGYCTADFDVWPNFIRFMLVVLMFFGGCAGSTGGGMKMIRIMVVLKLAWREVRTMIQPRLIFPIKIGKSAVDEKQASNIVGFFVIFLLLFVLFTCIMSIMIPDFTTAVTTVVATMCNIGPGLAGIGATENYAWIPPAGKWVLVLCMLLGRLEIYTVIIAFAPISWKR